MSEKPNVIIGQSGASGQGWSELKDIECTKRYSFIKRAAEENEGKPRIPTSHDEAFQAGSFMHAARAHWIVSGQVTERSIINECCEAGKADCAKQEMPLSELSFIEYSLLFLNYANYWAIRPKLVPYAVELFLSHNFGGSRPEYERSTRYDDVSYYKDVAGHCIGEFKTTYSLAGSLKYYSEFNPQILLQQLIYVESVHGHPEIKGTMVDIWDKGKSKGTRHFVPINHARLGQFKTWLLRTLQQRHELLTGLALPHRNFLVCNTFNDAYNSQCAWKERCMGND